MIVHNFARLPSGCQCTELFPPPAASLAVVPSVSGHRQKEGIHIDMQTQSLHQRCVPQVWHIYVEQRSPRNSNALEVVVA